jgi:hypothetical protein
MKTEGRRSAVFWRTQNKWRLKAEGSRLKASEKSGISPISANLYLRLGIVEGLLFLFLFSPSTPLRAVSLSNGHFDIRNENFN